jgi:hypothetical protein
MKVIGGGDGRRRVGVKDVKGDMTCEVLGKMWDPQHQQEGIVMSVEGDVQVRVVFRGCDDAGDGCESRDEGVGHIVGAWKAQ